MNDLNELIENIFENFTVNNVSIPVSFLRYEGSNTSYVTYMEHNIDDTYYTDNSLTNYMTYYDFDIYSKNNYINIVKSVKKILKENGFIWQPTMTSYDMYEDDTGYYHKTLCFAYIINENDEESED